MIEEFPGTGLEDGNYCRDPKGNGDPFCFTKMDEIQPNNEDDETYTKIAGWEWTCHAIKRSAF